LSLQKKDWLEINEDLFSDLSKRSPISRAGLEGMRRNVTSATNKK
jgi:epoxyqueuosine reductase QueG